MGTRAVSRALTSRMPARASASATRRTVSAGDTAPSAAGSAPARSTPPSLQFQPPGSIAGVGRCAATPAGTTHMSRSAPSDPNWFAEEPKTRTSRATPGPSTSAARTTASTRARASSRSEKNIAVGSSAGKARCAAASSAATASAQRGGRAAGNAVSHKPRSGGTPRRAGSRNDWRCASRRANASAGTNSSSAAHQYFCLASMRACASAESAFHRGSHCSSMRRKRATAQCTSAAARSSLPRSFFALIAASSSGSVAGAGAWPFSSASRRSHEDAAGPGIFLETSFKARSTHCAKSIAAFDETVPARGAPTRCSATCARFATTETIARGEIFAPPAGSSCSKACFKASRTSSGRATTSKSAEVAKTCGAALGAGGSAAASKSRRQNVPDALGA
mmetsp:Transcript_19675/g.66544  ORF Transcript_19675/g.66544 Transcript_19675/m.66544 type:complete len:393 (-) Transcript_19675:203-1381(-)